MAAMIYEMLYIQEVQKHINMLYCVLGMSSFAGDEKSQECKMILEGSQTIVTKRKQ